MTPIVCSRRSRRRAALVPALLSALALAAVLPAPATAQANCASPPSVTQGAADPGVSTSATGYALVATSPVAEGLRIRRSADGINWCYTGERVLASIPGGIVGGSFWAPQLYEGATLGVAVYAALRKIPARFRSPKKRGQTAATRRNCIGIAVRRADGYVPMLISGKRALCDRTYRFSMIDASLFFAGSQAYLLYKEDPDPRARRAGHVKRIVIRRVNFSGVARNRVELGGIRELLRAEGWEGISVEAPTMVFKDGRYYLFYSGGDYTDRSYGVGVARSVRPNGGFHRLPGNPIVGGPRKSPKGQCGVGHQDVTFRPPADWRIYYHYALQRMVKRGSRKVPICNTRDRRLTHKSLDWPVGRRPDVRRPAGRTSSLPGVPGRRTCVSHPREASVVCVRNDARTVDVCDRHADGHRVYARVITDASTPAFLSPFYDENDSRRGCANVTFSSRVASFAVCVQYEGCSAFTSTDTQPPPPAPVPAPALPAAQDVCASHPSDPSVVCTRNAGFTVDVCDRDADGHRAYARVVTQASLPGFQSPYYDTNDSRPGCANISFAGRVLGVAVCVQSEGCSAFSSTFPQGPPPAPAPAPPPPAPAPAPPRPPARDVCATHPSDPSVVCTRNAGHTVDVCDRDPDGHRAYARVVTEASWPNFQSPYYDTNDSQPGCANVGFTSRVLSVAVCVQHEGCSAVKPT
ncbi:MAG: GH43_30 / GH43 / GH43_33 / GH43_3 / GH43_31 [uncultured Solirubrobacteraceae bacterium]|uniref:GH43_30 / GH43 / GH43_33 / GH43_3 / GH43_31 n=1 Tax=uncultured Solirubrobacteraceae bacterium TaxID=1162706 RepID=A0A6J4SRI1_9ACTN|nr:MAG: GH43_30 / GH43 / GH43_33 / GH43_3 / GH43_31 [uncultured Solirubrobacteraceae bacterium]